MIDPRLPARGARPHGKKLMRAPRFMVLPDVHPLVRGRLNLLGGALESNKSTLLCLYAARYSQLVGRVAIISSEDDWEEEYGPRLEAAGANLDRIVFKMKEDKPKFKFPESTDALMEWLEDNDCKFPIFDLGNSFAAGNLREAYEPFKVASYRDDVTSMLSLHTNKHYKRGMAAIDTIPGSRRDIQGLVKHVMIIAKAADDPVGTRYVAVAKLNSRVHPLTLTYAVDQTDLAAHPEWHPDEAFEEIVFLRQTGTSDLTAEGVVAQASRIEDEGEDDAPLRSEAAKALCDILKDGKAHPVPEIKKVICDDLGICSWSTVKRARESLGAGVESRRAVGDPTGKRKEWIASSGLLAELQQGDNPDQPEDLDTGRPDWLPDA
jgi:hypothetical protein